MSVRSRPSQEDSNYYEPESIIIHDDVETVGTASTLDALLTTQSVPSSAVPREININHVSLRPKSARINDSKTGRGHTRDLSVSTTVHSRYLNQAPSLIALLDVQKSSRMNVPITSFRLSKSMPVYNGTPAQDTHINGNNSPSIHSDDDFETPTAHKISVEIYNEELKDNASTDSIIIHDDKCIEYEALVHMNQNNSNNVTDNDDMVDMRLLAFKAAQEFTIIANENEQLSKDNLTLKEKYSDLQHDKAKLLDQLTVIKSKYSDNNELIDDIERMKSSAAKWKMEKKVLMEQLEKSRKHSDTSDMDLSQSRNGKLSRLKLTNDTSEDAQRLMMESLAQISREKNEMAVMMDDEKMMKREYEKTISNLKRNLRDKELERQQLSNNLDKQQELYYSLKQNARKKEKEIGDIVGKNIDATLAQQQKQHNEKMQLLEAVDEQKAYIHQLEEENQKLMNLKIIDDDHMFDELKQLRSHGFQVSMQFDGISNFASSDGTHSRDPSMSNYSQSGFGGIFTNQSNAELGLKTVRTQINLFSVEDFSMQEGQQNEFDDIIIDMEPALPDKNEEQKESTETPDTDTPQPTVEKAKKVVFRKGSTGDKLKVIKEQQKKRDEMFKINAEIEFFLLTCIAVKSNLVEEYPMKPEVMTENAMQLFEAAQKEHIVMSKFNLWIEYKLRDKYDLPKLQGFAKFIEKHHVKDKLYVGYSKTKKQTKKLAEKTENASRKAGLYIAGKAEEIGARIRAISRPQQEDNEENKVSENDETPIQTNDETSSDEKIGAENGNNNNDTVIVLEGNDDRTETKDEINKQIEDNPPQNNTDDRQCCVIL